VYERLFDQRTVLAQGHLDDEAATRLCAQLLTLDAEAAEPIRLELQGLDAELTAALTVIGVLETLRVPVLACVAGRLRGPALGVLAACGQRRAYPNAVLELSEPRLSYTGPVTAIAAQDEQAQAMADALWERIALTTGREVDEIRAGARRTRFFTVAEAIGYGLLTDRAAAR
jgi:ATP-dependent Clp protease protease subunit